MRHCVFRELGRGANAELVLDAGFVKLHRFDRDVQNRRNLLDGFAFGHQLENLTLSGCEVRGFFRDPPARLGLSEKTPFRTSLVTAGVT